MTEQKEKLQHPGLVFSGILLMVVFIGVALASTIVGYVGDFEHHAVVGCVEGDVISYSSGSSPFNAAQYAYFVVRLPSGKRTTIKDVGTKPEAFRGTTMLRKQRGTVTGAVRYIFAKKGECKSP